MSVQNVGFIWNLTKCIKCIQYRTLDLFESKVSNVRLHSGYILLNVSKQTNSSINNMASTSVPEPVVVLYKSSVCRHCNDLMKIWDTSNKDDDTITGALKKVNPKIRFFVLTAKDNTGKFDENTAPKDLIRYGKWYPMILVIPGRKWDAAMSKLGPKNDVELVEGVQIMNGMWDGNELKYVQKYDIRKPSEFGRWIKDAIDNDDFKRIQNGPSLSSNIIVPTIQTAGSHPIQPLLSNIVRPGNTNNNYVAAGTIDRPELNNDICSMRIISRPR